MSRSNRRPRVSRVRSSGWVKGEEMTPRMASDGISIQYVLVPASLGQVAAVRSDRCGATTLSVTISIGHNHNLAAPVLRAAANLLRFSPAWALRDAAGKSCATPQNRNAGPRVRAGHGWREPGRSALAHVSNKLAGTRMDFGRDAAQESAAFGPHQSADALEGRSLSVLLVRSRFWR